jgi:lipopolysaccharide transport system ATP-binding protein
MHEGSSTAAERSWDDADNLPGGDVARLRNVRIKEASGATTATVDIRAKVGFEMTFDVIQDGRILLPHFKLVNDEGIYVFITLDTDPEWRKKKRPKGTYTVTAWVPGNLLTEGSFFINATLLTQEPETTQFNEREVASFQVIDSMEGDSARGDWVKDLKGVVRPLLEWETEYSNKI